jgi:hypothetical protein
MEEAIMKKLLPVVAVVAVLIAAVAVVAVIVRGRDGSHADARSTPTAAASAQQTTGTVTPGTPEVTTQPAVPPAPAATQGRPFGNIVATFRGTAGRDSVSCGSVETEFAVSMSSGDGTVRWTGQARDIMPERIPFEGSQLAGITLEPDTGLLELGQRQVIRVRGTFNGRPGQQFWVVVQAPNAIGTGWTSILFSCR